MTTRVLPQVLCALALAVGCLRGDPGDVENSHDYPGFTRPAGFVISDFDEDNPADFDFPVAHPLPTDSGHVDTIPVRGHRFVIRYELSTGNAPSLFQTQRYYEKLASDNGFTIEKTGASGDTTETFHKTTSAHEIWIYLEPAQTVNVVTVVETAAGATLLPPPERIVATPPPVRAVMPTAIVPRPPFPVSAPQITPVPTTPAPALKPAPTPPPMAPTVAPSVAPTVATTDPEGDALFDQLVKEGRIIVAFTFQPGKDELDASAQPLIARVAAMMKKHPDVFLRIEGHTDNSGDPEASLRLSAQRALAVQSALTDASVDKKRLDAVGVGGLQPLADNATAQGREKNRRIELVMWKHYSHTPATQ